MTSRATQRALLTALRVRRALCAALVLCCWLAPQFRRGVARADSSPAYRLLVHPDNPVNAVSREFATQALLKRTTRWADGETIHPVDQRVNSEVRRRFSENVLKRSVSAVKRYWQQRIFSGRDLPPPELDNDEAVVSYVLKHRGSIGYVSGSAKFDRAKPVQVQ